MSDQPIFTAFVGPRRLASGPLGEVAAAVHALGDEAATALVIADATGRTAELDLRGDIEEVRTRYGPAAPAKPARGRPRLGVAAREVTLLPSHWDWLASQPGGASAALRRLVDQARRSGSEQQRQAKEAAHRVLTLLAGDLPQYEEVLRAFYAGDDVRLTTLVGAWPADMGDYVLARVSAARNPGP